MNVDNYIFRSIKLEKELNKIKKKIHSDMGNKELRALLPYEQFLKNALLDEDEDDPSSSEGESLESLDNKSSKRKEEPETIMINEVDEDNYISQAHAYQNPQVY